MITGQDAYGYVRSVGMNLHIDQQIGQWSNYPYIEAFLKALRITSVRTSGTIYSGHPERLAFMNKLHADLGITSVEIFNASVTNEGPVASVIAQRNGINHIEGPNEQDICCDDAAWIAHDQQTISQLSVAHTFHPSVDVFAPNVSQADPGSLGDLSTLVQYGNNHFYTANRPPETPGWGGIVYGQVYGSIGYAIAQAKRAAPGLPVVTTEAGFSTSFLSEATQAAYVERMTLLMYQNGIKRTWIYDLVDDYQSYGMARPDGTMKQVAYGLQGLLGILSDDTPFPGKCSTDAIALMQGSYASELLCKSNGEKDLVLWQPVQLQDPNTGAPEPATPQALIVNATGSPGSTMIYSQDTNYRWSAVVAPPNGYIASLLTERPLIIAFNAHQPIKLLPFPVGNGNGGSVGSGNKHISSSP